MHSKATGKTTVLLNPNWPEAAWNLCGVFASDAQLLMLHDRLLSRHRLKPIARVHGAIPSQWSGARFPGHLDNIANIGPILQGYAEKGMSVTVDFTGANAGSRLDDHLGNFILLCLSRFNAGGNGVCVCDDALAAHVRQHHPNLKIAAASAKADQENCRERLDYYQSLEGRYNLIQIHPDDNLDLDLLSRLNNRHLYEITVNDPCIRNCPDRKAHHQADSDHYFNFLDSKAVKQGMDLIFRNECENFQKLLLSKEKRTLVLSTHDLRRIYDLGFRNFQIDDGGRANDASRLVMSLHWLLSDDPDQDHLSARVIVDLLMK